MIQPNPAPRPDPVQQLADAFQRRLEETEGRVDTQRFFEAACHALPDPSQQAELRKKVAAIVLAYQALHGLENDGD